MEEAYPAFGGKALGQNKAEKYIAQIVKVRRTLFTLEELGKFFLAYF